jgi:hypothetical protein
MQVLFCFFLYISSLISEEMRPGERQCPLVLLVKVRRREGKALGFEEGKALGSVLF